MSDFTDVSTLQGWQYAAFVVSGRSDLDHEIRAYLDTWYVKNWRYGTI